MYTSLREQDAHNIRAGIHMGEGSTAAYVKVLITKKRELIVTVVQRVL